MGPNKSEYVSWKDPKILENTPKIDPNIAPIHHVPNVPHTIAQT